MILSDLMNKNREKKGFIVKSFQKIYIHDTYRIRENKNKEKKEGDKIAVAQPVPLFPCGFACRGQILGQRTCFSFQALYTYHMVTSQSFSFMRKLKKKGDYL